MTTKNDSEGGESKREKAILPVLSSPNSRRRGPTDHSMPQVSVLVQGRFGESNLSFFMKPLSC